MLESDTEKYLERTTRSWVSKKLLILDGILINQSTKSV